MGTSAKTMTAVVGTQWTVILGCEDGYGTDCFHELDPPLPSWLACDTDCDSDIARNGCVHRDTPTQAGASRRRTRSGIPATRRNSRQITIAVAPKQGGTESCVSARGRAALRQ